MIVIYTMNSQQHPVFLSNRLCSFLCSVSSNLYPFSSQYCSDWTKWDCVCSSMCCNPQSPLLIINGHVILQSSPHPLHCVHACLSHVLECSVHFHSLRHLPRFQRRTLRTVWVSRRRSNTWRISFPYARCPLCRWTTPPSCQSFSSSAWWSGYVPPAGAVAVFLLQWSPLSSR